MILRAIFINFANPGFNPGFPKLSLISIEVVHLHDFIISEGSHGIEK